MLFKDKPQNKKKIQALSGLLIYRTKKSTRVD